MVVMAAIVLIVATAIMATAAVTAVAQTELMEPETKIRAGSPHPPVRRASIDVNACGLRHGRPATADRFPGPNTSPRFLGATLAASAGGSGFMDQMVTERSSGARRLGGITLLAGKRHRRR
jgi:hypothetical protein